MNPLITMRRERLMMNLSQLIRKRLEKTKKSLKMDLILKV